MNNNQAFINQNQNDWKIANSNKILLPLFLSILLSTLISGSIVYFWQKSIYEKKIEKIQQDKIFLEEQIATIKDNLLTPTIIPKSQTQPSPTKLPDPTANWKGYTNTKLGFSVKYPKNWPEPQERILSTRADVEFKGTMRISVGVFYDQEKQRELTYLEIAKQYANGKKEPQQITVDGQPAAYLKIGGEDLVAPKPNLFNLVAIQKGKTVYTIEYSFGITSLEEEQKIFDLILSTFKFTN
jgi:hypothetical protein